MTTEEELREDLFTCVRADETVLRDVLLEPCSEPMQVMQGKSEVWTQVLFVNPQNSDPP